MDVNIPTHVRLTKCNSPGLPDPSILWQTIDMCINTAFTKATTIARTFPPGAARPVAFTAFRLTFLNGKTFDFAVSDLKITYIAQV